MPQFEGPLGLLLYLIRKEEMDIFDIDIHLITTQYLEYIKRMKQFDLEVAGDFVAMAATLIQIKSRMLLPNYNEDGEEEEVIDPRKELVQRLIEYQKFQELSQDLYKRPLLGRDVFKRGKTESILTDEEGEIIIDEGGLFSLIALYRGAVRKAKKAVHRVARKTRSIASRILEMKDQLIVGQRVLLREIIAKAEDAKAELLITFLSMLELGKMGYVSVYQAEVYGDIYLTPRRAIDGNIVERVEEYDSHDSEEIADHLMEQALEDQEIDFDDLEEEEEDSENQILASDEDIDAAEREFGPEELGETRSFETTAEPGAPAEEAPVEVAVETSLEPEEESSASSTMPSRVSEGFMAAASAFQAFNETTEDKNENPTDMNRETQNQDEEEPS
ncbi:MAG: segregation/condensation protein A [Bdellovibrionales bacterium]|nr:segregation/condensation protein A [Bdellovibrionales bacterium]